SWTRTFVDTLRAVGIDAPASAAAGADAGPDVAEIGVPDALVTTRIDAQAFAEQKLAALRCHASQMPPDHFLRRMPGALARELWCYEFFSRDGAAAPESD